MLRSSSAHSHCGHSSPRWGRIADAYVERGSDEERAGELVGVLNIVAVAGVVLVTALAGTRISTDGASAKPIVAPRRPRLAALGWLTRHETVAAERRNSLDVELVSSRPLLPTRRSKIPLTLLLDPKC